MQKEIINILVCPKCKKPLNQDERRLVCRQCNQVYNIDKGIINFQVELLEEIKALSSEYMDMEADYYDKIHLHMSQENDLFQGIIKEVSTSGKIILDVATGTGFILDNFEALNKEGKFLCLDISRNMLRRAIQKHGKRIALALRADAECIPIKDSSIDMVTISSSLHHLPNPPKALQEIYRVLMPGGIFLIFHEPTISPSLGFLFKYFNRICTIYNNLRPKTKEEIERKRRVKEYAKEIFGIEEEAAFQRMQDWNRRITAQAGFNPSTLLSNQLYEILKIQHYYSKKTMINELKGILFPSEGELFYIVAKKRIRK